MFYTAPKPTQALLVTGGFFSRKDVPFRVVVGRGTFYLPFIHRVYRFYIGSRYVRVNVEAQTHQNISVNIEATLAYRVNKDIVSIVEAGSRFLGSNDKAMSDVISSIFSGEVRSLVGARSVEEIITNRDALNMDVLTATGPKLMEMGLKIDNFQINEISDDEGHIKNLSQPELNRVRKIAEVAGRIATALAGSNITMFNGAEGLTNIVTEVAGTASHLVNALKPAVQDQASHRRSQ